MATRPVYIVSERWPYFKTVDISFDWNSGFSAAQKQKNIKAIHERFSRMYPENSVLEISSKSLQEHGKDLSAFFLKKYVPHLNQSVPVECVFQAGKVFANGGPYTDILEKSPRDAKRDERLKTSGRLIGFRYEDMEFPLNPKTLFYDYLYINALLESPELIESVVKYDGFTDIEFNPERSVNCQAKAAALFVSIYRLNLLDQVKTLDSFMELMSYKPEKPNAVKEEKPLPEVKVAEGMIINHKVWGKGEVLSADNSTVTIQFDSVGEKRLGIEWILKNCF